MKVNIEDVIRIANERKAINSLDLNEIEWYQNGVKIEISKEVIEDFELTGLSNMDFITGNYWGKK